MESTHVGQKPSDDRPQLTVRADEVAVIQRSLRVGAADDPYERQADAMADEVVARIRRASTATLPTGADEARNPRVQRAPTSSTVASRHTRTPPAQHIHRMAPRSPAQSAAVVGAEGGELPTDIERGLRAASGGRALDTRIRRSMEHAFGREFGAVRIHTDSSIAGEIGATAFTNGSDIHFGPGQFDPSSPSGQHLLAHELTHTVQQGAASTTRRSIAGIQRDHTDSGIKKEAAVATFATKVKKRATGAKNPLGSTKQWDTLSADARAAKLTKYVNAELTKAHVPAVAYTLDAGTTAGNAEFDFTTWSLTIGSNGLDGALGDDVVGEFADVVYHESRHAEQWFRIARLKAGESPSPTAGQIESSLFIPANIAEAASKRPMKPLTKIQRFFHTKKHNERQDAKLGEAQSWYESIYGSNRATREEVLGDIDNRHAEYLALSEEVDAWDVGGKAGSKVRALIADLRTKRAAAAAAKSAKAAKKKAS